MIASVSRKRPDHGGGWASPQDTTERFSSNSQVFAQSVNSPKRESSEAPFVTCRSITTMQLARCVAYSAINVIAASGTFGMTRKHLEMRLHTFNRLKVLELE